MKPEDISLQSSANISVSGQYRSILSTSENSDEIVPERSKFWFKQKVDPGYHNGQILDSITIVYTFLISLFSLFLFWPIVSRIMFEEAFFTPLAPFLINAITLGGLSWIEAMRVLFMASFMSSTAGIYLFCRYLTGRQIVPVLTTIIYLLPPLPFFILTFFQRGLFENELTSASSFFTTVYGDGAHFLALAFLPFASLFFLRFVKENKPADLAAVVFFASMTLLSNRSHALNMFLIFAALTLTDFFIDQNKAKIGRFLKVVVLSIGLVSFWYTPTFWFSSFNSLISTFIKNSGSLFPLPVVLGVLSLLASFAFFARKAQRQAIFASFLLFILFGGITLGWIMGGNSFVPHPQRLLPLVNIFGAMVLALSLAAVIDRFKIAKTYNLEMAAAPIKIVVWVIFAISCLSALTFSLYFANPYISVAAGGGELWSKISQNVLADSAQTMAIAGGNLKLIGFEGDAWQMFFGLIATVASLAFLGYLILRDQAAKIEKN